MSIKRIFIVISAIFAVSAVFADNSSVTSKKYVDDLMSGYQGKLPGSGANTLMIYDDETGIGEKSIAATLGNSASAVSVPTVGAVKTGLDGKQDTITGTAGYVMTGTGNAGEVGERAIYGTAFYGDSLVTAENVNTGVTNAVNNSLIRVDENGNPSNTGTLWEINTDLFALVVLPAGYTQLEWIESDGTQYIDTGYALQTDNFEIDAKYMKTATGPMFGARSRISPYVGPIESSVSNVPIAYWDNNNDWLKFLTQLNTVVDAVYKSENLAVTAIVNGLTRTATAARSFVNGNNIYLFANNASPVQIGVGIIYSFKIYDNGALVRDMIPASKVENNETVVGLYDTVSGQFFPDAAGGNFTAGPPVVSTGN